jgi:hypothetical protein
MLPARYMMNHLRICRAAVPPLALALSGCVQPVVQSLPLHVAAPAAGPIAGSPALATERLDLALHAGGLAWQSVGTGPLPGGGEMQEYVPAGQTIADWSQMITTLTLPAAQDPAARLTAILDGLRGACRSYRVIQSATQETPYHSANLLARCDQPDEPAFTDPNVLLLKHEVIWAKTLEGHAGNYVVWRAWHGDKIDPDSVLASGTTRQEWQAWVDRVVVRQ